jgi:hypothetical protein
MYVNENWEQLDLFTNCSQLKFVGLPGFEPRQTEPKTVVLPLHNNPILNFGVQK